jgi:hypothetical protein
LIVSKFVYYSTNFTLSNLFIFLIVNGGKFRFETENSRGKISRMKFEICVKNHTVLKLQQMVSTEKDHYSKKKLIVAEITLCRKYNTLNCLKFVIDFGLKGYQECVLSWWGSSRRFNVKPFSSRRFNVKPFLPKEV